MSPIPLTITRTRLTPAVALTVAGVALASLGQASDVAPEAAAARLGASRVLFVENLGQFPGEVAFYAGGAFGDVAFGPDGLEVSRVVPRPRQADQPAYHLGPRPLGRRARMTSDQYARHTVAMRFVDAAGATAPHGLDPQGTRINFFKGGPADWVTDVPTFGRIVYRDLWPGIDLEWTGTPGGVKYRYRVAPGVDPGVIRLAWTGVEAGEVDPDGSLRLAAPWGPLSQAAPVAYQERGGRRVAVTAGHAAPVACPATPPVTETPLDPAACALSPDTLVTAFQMGPFDSERPLYIDPVLPVYAGFLGFGGADRGLGMALDSHGRAILTGSILAPGAVDDDAYVARLNAHGTAIDFVTFIGGAEQEGSFDIDIDSAGNTYLTGFTGSDESSFPVQDGPDLTFNGVIDVLVAKLSADGNELIYAGYIGGELIDFGEGIAVDAAGNAFVFGPVLSSHATFPVKVGPDLTFNRETDAFICKVIPEPDNPEVKDNLAYCGYIGGDAADIHMAVAGADSFYSLGHVAVDAAGAAYLVGTTTSDETSFPDGSGFGTVPGAVHTYAGGIDAYVVKVRPDGSGLDYATFVGGTEYDVGKGIAVDSAGSVHFSGHTASREDSLPVVGGPDLTYNGGELDALAGKLNPAGTAFDYLGYVGGAAVDGGEAVALAADGSLIVVGYSDSPEDSFPVKEGPDLTQNDAISGEGDAMVVRIRPHPAAAERMDNLDFAGFVGGANFDQAFWVDVDSSDSVYVVGDTASGSDTFPDGDGMGELTSWSAEFHGETDAFAVKIYHGDVIPTRVPSPTPSPSPEANRGLYLPVAVARASLAGTQPVVAAAWSAPEQVDRVETSFDDFCDFGIGWGWEEGGNLRAHLAADERLRCYYRTHFSRNNAWLTVSNGHRATGEFAVETELSIAGVGGLSGLVFGVDPALTGWYTFVSDAEGATILAKTTNRQAQLLARGTAPIAPGEPIRLMVVVRPTELVTYVNDELVARTLDAGPRAGRVGIYSEWDGTGTEFETRHDFIRISRLAVP